MPGAAADNRPRMSRTGVYSFVTMLAALWAASAMVAPAATSASVALGARHLAVAAGANRIAIDAPDGAKQRKTYDVTIHGFARRRASAYLFVDYVGCAGSFATERARAATASDSYAVKGRFTELSGWKSSTRGVDHACAYLVSAQSGNVVATAHVSFQIR